MVTPRITVLMPVYNAASFLQEAIDSILSQTFTDFEFLIIDDGSTDNSLSIIQGYHDHRINLIRNPKNLGISETLNKGIELSTCELIARMDADDISMPTRLQKQYDYMLAHPDCALLSTWARVVAEDKTLVRVERYPSQYYYFNLTFECWMYHPTVMFRKKAVKEVGMYSIPYSEDYDLFWKLSTKFEIGNLQEELVHYRLSPTSLNTVLKKTDYDIYNERNVLRNIRFYLGENFVLSKESLECLRHNFTPIVKRNDLNEVFQCLSILDRITERILEIKNPNRHEVSIREAKYFKRKFILQELVRAFPAVKGLMLLMQTREWLLLYTISMHSAKWRLKKLKTFLLSF